MNWRRQHKWSGIAAAVLLLIFCVSGVVLNHRDLVGDFEISRRWLPPAYAFDKWNGGLLRGTLSYGDSVLIYGVNGVFLSDSAASHVKDFNHGLPEGADLRQIRRVAYGTRGYHALTPTGLYRLNDKERWEEVSLPVEGHERLSDLSVKGDSLIVAGRSYIYLSPSPSSPFVKLALGASNDNDGKVSLLRTVWMLHSGELFGTPGKLMVDFLAILMMVLALTGVAIWLMPKYMQRKVRTGGVLRRSPRLMKPMMKYHKIIGSLSVFFLVIVAVTGWCLRPPVMIPLAINRTHPVPGSSMDTGNPWEDKLRMLRYDVTDGDWLLSTSDGFYSMTDLNAEPKKVEAAPPVSVMGLNVMDQGDDGQWLCGSFSGMFLWDRSSGKAHDFFTGEETEGKAGPPFGKYAVSGYSREFNTIVEYNDGTSAISQPDDLRYLPMSLWNVALEAHSGRLFIGQIATYVFIFIAGLVVVWCLYSGWKVRHNGSR